MAQRKLMLPAFHGERMERLTDLVTSVTSDEIERGSRGQTELHPRFQALTLEIILRAVFGLDPGPRLDAIRESLTALLAYGDSPLTLIPPPEDPARLERPMESFNRSARSRASSTGATRWTSSSPSRSQSAALRPTRTRDDVLAMLLAARHEDGSPMSRPELRDELDDPARRRPRDDGLDARLDLLPPRARAARARRASPRGRLRGRRPVPHRDDPGGASQPARSLPNATPRYVAKPITVGGWDYEPGVLPRRQRLPHPSRSRHLPRPLHLPPGALPRREARHLHVDSVRRRPPAVPRARASRCSR